MRLLRYIYLFVFVVITANLYSQPEEYMFNHFKTLGEKYVIYVRIAGLSDDVEEQDRVLSALLEDKNISDGSIYSVENQLPTCQLEISPNISVNYIRAILLTTGYDIDLTSVTSKNPAKPDGVYGAERYSFFEGFDAYKNYNPNKAGSLSPEDHYANEKDKWIKENPDEYAKVKKSSGTTVIVKKKDLETFTAEKRSHILSHPEIFIIE